MTDERNETWADIAAELRAEAAREMEDPGGWYEQPTEVVANRLNGLADRIEAAGNREGIRRDKTSFHCGDCAKFGFDCDAGDVDGNEDCLACENFVRGDHFRGATKMVGNAAKLREALQMFIDSVEWLCDGDKSGRIKRQFAVLLSDARAALAAPPSNCDRFANIPGDAICAWLKEDPATRYMTNEEQNAAAVFARWFFDVAAQEGGAR